MAEIPDWMVAIVDLAADQLALDMGACPCPCHKVIQDGLIPCPQCDPEPDHSSRYEGNGRD